MLKIRECVVLKGRRNLEVEISSRIGMGSWGEAWKAREVATGQTVVIKELSEKISEREKNISLTNHENALWLDHPNLVEIIEVDREKKLICMEYLEGFNLSSELWTKPLIALELKNAIKIAIEILKGLMYLGELEVIHQDLKPSNIYISKRGPVILDFDILKSVISGVNLGVLGSPLYMSPEQAIGVERLSTRSDVFSFGLIFYEMIAGTSRFRNKFDKYEAEKTRETRSRYRETPIEITSVSEEICQFTYNCLRQRPENRYSAKDALERLENIAKDIK